MPFVLFRQHLRISLSFNVNNHLCKIEIYVLACHVFSAQAVAWQQGLDLMQVNPLQGALKFQSLAEQLLEQAKLTSTYVTSSNTDVLKLAGEAHLQYAKILASIAPPL